MYRIVILGPQGSGKNTQAELLAKKFGIPMISAGDLWRAEIVAKTELGLKAEPILAAGKLAPNEWTIELVKKRVAEPDTKEGFILNGYPRTMPQAQALEAFASPTHVIDLALSDEEAIARLSGRRVCAVCGRNYHLIHNPSKKEGVCDIDGSPLVIRDDDKPEAVRTRLAIYRQDTEPLFDFYRPRGIVRTINAAQTMEKVFEDIVRVL
ncbi:adenylate kinase [Candidatus Uhrbacteria bacterium RIFCSPLOWO2_01_FULL_47_24]|uniref:Adenylate kinase n=1 Tax=Candidatus Uhrbacteria bacterium RIFCSPLOWO2_01_FULL_47_24 TaxID=1802401 RepID=A0A1F7UTS0_9BACT|nr:MAG: adenylate kinase [Candidatus Uhrbacteria bacterium RIFCSPHIGHO2_01_FULL_47_11]OGL68959.1 MAG: adenylate kinase [Candidatus Uhrbacteria bacterium RIFCSPHIGHO2_02_FULL_46_47]OGL74924.1 MAG: adenylate kinase [Candidatus Uhrbacteria bacterium RIFCSPHIGHO2_12_FULL_47_11]OGL81665.1 MAG: adenylate kinase [Candidatus Uhrbacteria bacterium RIFCSPLOWO2_01_FULL_47_24]OGL85082.1 MAG: adenylate kinase [Candidatus Uhrbacteria bacterium RIFCSPLOWO2_02_FULL_46_25]OGL93571.1 MAG: adenylate kinase [Cand